MRMDGTKKLKKEALMKKLIALICALVLCLGAIPSVLADDMPDYPYAPVDPSKQYA